MKKNKNLFLAAIILCAVVVYLFVSRTNSTVKKELSDFAVKDTASITRIFLADKTGKQSLLVRESPSRWKVNGKYYARSDAMNYLLATIASIEVRSPAAKAAFNNVMREMAATGIKVEIYQEDKLIKVYYVGHETPDQLGTYMYLENSSVPFVVHIPGFDGILNIRYITDENDWKEKAVFRLGRDEISSISLQYFDRIGSSFILKRNPQDEFDLLTNPQQEKIAGASQDKIQNYLELYSGIFYEMDADYIKKETLDSIKINGPFAVLSVKDRVDKTKVLRLFRLPLVRSKEELENIGINTPLPFDTDRLLFTVDGDSGNYIGQIYTFGKLLKQPGDFRNAVPQP